MIIGFAHNAYRVMDMEKSLAFYCGILGFEQIFTMYDDNGNPTTVYLKIAHEQFLELFYGGTNRPDTSPHATGYCHLCLAVDDAAKEYERIQTVWPIKRPLKTGRDTNWQFWITDPDGNDIEFMQLCPTSKQYQSCH
ncbi:MAG: VOC family protein [Candidatus Merdivicinus sp.]